MSLNRQLYGEYKQESLKNLHNSLLEHFYSVMFNRGDSMFNSEGTPDISGYTLIFLVPPILSGMAFDVLPVLSRNCRLTNFEFHEIENGWSLK